MASKMRSKFTVQIRSLLKLIGYYVLFFGLFRIVFYLYFSQFQSNLKAKEVFEAFYFGFRFDLRIALYAALPLLFVGFLPNMDWNKNAATRTWNLTIQALLSIIFLQIFFWDIGYFSYLASRINITIFQFLQNTDISVEMLWQTYNLPLIFTAMGLLIGIQYKILNQWVFPKKYIYPTNNQPDHQLQKKISKRTKIGFNIVLFLLFGLGIHGTLSQYPLRWSSAFFSNNSFISYLALNPIHYFVDSYSNVDTQFDKAKFQKTLPIIQDYLGVPEANRNSSNPLRRKIKVSPYLPQNMNVIYIVMESYSAAKMDYFGAKSGASPVMDDLAQKSWIFTNFYTPVEGTARSMFCTLTSLPDINAESTSSRNPLIINQNSLINAFKNHQKFYMIGGSADWGNIRGTYQNNIENLNILEEKDFSSPRTDVWGLSDLDLFREAARVLIQKSKQGPFYAIIQTAGYHRPYTIPDDHGDFKLKNLSDSELDGSGFSSNEEYNSFRFSDYSLGQFIQLIKNEDFFKNTVFVIHGDHGLPHRGAKHLAEGYKLYEINRFHVPLIIFSDKLGPARVISKMMSQTDVLPTLAGIFGLEVEHQGLGINILAPNQNQEHFAFSYAYYDKPVTKYLYDERYLVFTNREGQVAGLFDYASSNPSLDIRDSEPERFIRMKELLNAFYESARYLVHNNSKIDYNAAQ